MRGVPGPEGTLPSDDVPSVLEPIRDEYRLVCVLCGNDDSRWYRFSRDEARALKPQPPCRRCGGVRWLVDDRSSISEPERAVLNFEKRREGLVAA